MSGDRIEIKEFTCPRCGSHHFGQTPAAGGTCHGYTETGACNFGFAFDDPRYFKGTGKFMPKTVGGFEPPRGRR